MTLEELRNKIASLEASEILNDELYGYIFKLSEDSPIDRNSLKNLLFARAEHLKDMKELKAVKPVKDTFRAFEAAEKRREERLWQEDTEARKESFLSQAPPWIDEKGNLDELEFCQSFGEWNAFSEYKYKCVNGLMYSERGHEPDEKLLKEIQEEISQFVKKDVSSRAVSLLRALKNFCYSEPPPLDPDRIHLHNGMYNLNDNQFYNEWGFCLNRLAVDYDHDAPMPELWLKYLDDLLYPEDIPTLQEYMGYCLVPTKRAQKMLYIVGNGGEGKSVIGNVMRALFGDSMVTGCMKDLGKDSFTTATLVNSLVMFDDDATSNGFTETSVIKNLVTDMNPIQVNPKGRPKFSAVIYSRLFALSNSPMAVLYDHSEGAFRRQIILNTKPKPLDRVDDTSLPDKLINELPSIFNWVLEGLIRLRAKGYIMTVSDRAKQNLENSKEESFNVLAFVKDEDYISFGNPDAEALSTDILNSYDLWCRENAETPLTERAVLRHLKQYAYKYGIRADNHLSSGRNKRGFKGVQINMSWSTGIGTHISS